MEIKNRNDLQNYNEYMVAEISSLKIRAIDHQDRFIADLLEMAMNEINSRKPVAKAAWITPVLKKYVLK